MGTLGRPAARAPINTGDIPDNIITSAKIAPDVLTAADIAPNAVTASELADDAVDTAAIADGAVDTARLAADAVDGTKIADNAIDSEHVAADSLDAEHYAAGSVDGTAIANDAVDSQHYAADSIDAEHYAAGSVDATAIANDAVDSQHYAADSIDAEHYAAGSVDAAAIADNAVTLAKMAGGIDGKIITYDASGDPALVGPGTDGQVLTSTGAGSPPAFEDAAIGFDADSAQVFNESGADVDFRFESGGDANMLFVDGGTNRVGVGTNAPYTALHVQSTSAGGDTTVTIKNNGDSNADTNCVLQALQSDRPGGKIVFGRENASSWASGGAYADSYIGLNIVKDELVSEAMRIKSSKDINCRGRLLVDKGQHYTSPAIYAGPSNRYLMLFPSNDWGNYYYGDCHLHNWDGPSSHFFYIHPNYNNGNAPYYYGLKHLGGGINIVHFTYSSVQYIGLYNNSATNRNWELTGNFFDAQYIASTSSVSSVTTHASF
jgi:hypothetical protein